MSATPRAPCPTNGRSAYRRIWSAPINLARRSGRSVSLGGGDLFGPAEDPHLLWPVAGDSDPARPVASRGLVRNIDSREAADDLLRLRVGPVGEYRGPVTGLDLEDRCLVVETAGEDEDPGRLHLLDQGAYVP